ncbi:MAG: PKD domain-containing protein [Anaerolineae bacterium]|nr:PKD domain-containing protein [Anaerolineae bacterium]
MQPFSIKTIRRARFLLIGVVLTGLMLAFCFNALAQGSEPGADRRSFFYQAAASVDLTRLTAGTLYTDTAVVFSADIAPDGYAKPYTYTLDYDDGVAITDTESADPLVVTHTFTQPGTYTVSLTIRNAEIVTPLVDQEQVTVVARVNVSHKLYLPLVLRNASSTPGPYQVTLTRVGAGTLYIDMLAAFEAAITPNTFATPFNYTINYGDGTVITATGNTNPLPLSHAFTAAGNYTVNITVWNSQTTTPLHDEIVVGVNALPAGSFPVHYPTDRTQSPITPYVANRMRQIAAQGSGLNPRVFMKVGDSITANGNFLNCFTNELPWGTTEEEYRGLGGRDELTQTIAYFSTTVGTTNAFERDSIAAYPGWGAGSPVEGDPTPLDQEIDAIHPQFAVVMYGTNDLGHGGSSDPSTDRYKFFYYPGEMMELVDRIMAQGVVPLMMTIPPRVDYPRYALLAPAYNLIVRGIAEAKQIPLIDYYRLLAPFDDYNYGIGSDGVHPTYYGDPEPNSWPALACNLTDPALNYGYNARNLATLVALDRARQVFDEDAKYLDVADPTQMITFTGSGAAADAFDVAHLPFTDMRDIKLAPNASLSDYSGCSGSADKPGPENVYRLVLTAPTRLRAFVAGHIVPGQDLDPYEISLYLLEGTPTGAACIHSHDVLIDGTLGPGTYYFSVDTTSVTGDFGTGEYFFGLMECADGDTACDEEL